MWRANHAGLLQAYWLVGTRCVVPVLFVHLIFASWSAESEEKIVNVKFLENLICPIFNCQPILPVLSLDLYKIATSKEGFAPIVQRITKTLEAFGLRLIWWDGSRCAGRLMLRHPDLRTHAEATAAFFARLALLPNARPSLATDQVCHKICATITVKFLPQ
jgi:hypothetical protein